jgi:integrase
MSQLLTDLLPTYFQSNIRIRKQDTRDHYYKSLRRFADYLGHEPTLDDLTDDNCTGFILWTVDTEKLTEVSGNQRAKQIRALWNWAAKRRIVEAFPTFQEIAEPELVPKAWSPEQLAQLFAACERQTGYIGPCRASLWWLALHNFLLDTGERTEASLSLRWEWYDAGLRTVSVPAKVRKGGKKAMVYRISERTANSFEQIRQPVREFVFERQFGTSAFLHRYSRLVKAAGLPTPRGKHGPKKMRITVFTMIECGGGDATAFARHSSRQVTDDSYIDRTLTVALSKNKWPPDAVPFTTKRSLLSRLFGGRNAAL